MISFARSANPYVTGLRPRPFFGARLEMLKKEQMLKKVNIENYPKYDLVKSTGKKKAA